MGQCVSIQVGPNAAMKDGHAKHLSHNSKKGSKRVKRAEESSDAETTDDEIADETPIVCDEHFGKHQSPIDIFTSSTHEQCATPMANADVESNPLRFNYPDLVRECTIINTGHTVQVNIPAHSKCSVSINGKKYDLKQFHFHTPSEHMLDTVQFEMEMHLVHINEQGEICVLGFIFTTKTEYFKSMMALSTARKEMIEETQKLIMSGGQKAEEQAANEEDPVHQEEALEAKAEERDGDATTQDKWDDKVQVMANQGRNRGESFVPGHDFLEQFWADLPLKKTEEPIPLSNPISFDYLFEVASKSFERKMETNEILLDMDLFEYPGSLTTPPYSEGVHWLVSRKLQFINVKQLNKLSSCWGHRNNARECQHYHERKVQIRSSVAVRGYFFQ